MGKRKIKGKENSVKNIQVQENISKGYIKAFQQKTSLLFVYLVSYLLVVVVMIVLSWSIMGQKTITALEDNAEENIYSSLKNLSSNFSNRLGELRQMAINMSKDPKLSLYKVNEGGYEAALLNQELDKYRSCNSFIDSIALVYFDSNYIATDHGFYKNDDYFNYIRSYPNWKMEDIYKSIQENPNPFFHENDAVLVNRSLTQNCMTLIHPMYNEGAILFTITEETMFVTMDNALRSYSGSLYILDEKKKLLISRNKSSGLGDVSFLKNLPLDRMSIYKYNNDEYMVIPMEDAVTQYTYVALLPQKQFNEYINSAKLFNALLLFLLLFLGVVGAIAISVWNYRPISRLIGAIGNNKERVRSQKNEMQLIIDSIHQMRQQNSNLSDKLYYSTSYIREYTLLLLLYGRSKEISREALSDLLDLGNVNLQTGSYSVILFKNETVGVMHKDTPEMQFLVRYGMINVIEEIASEFEQGYCVDLPGQSVVAFILRVKSHINWREQIETLTEEMQEKLLSIFQTNVYIGVGNPQTLSDIAYSFSQAEKAIAQSLFKNERRVKFFQDLDESFSGLNTSILEEMQLITAMKSGDYEQCKTELDEIVKQFTCKSFSSSGIRFMWVGLVNRIWRTVAELNLQLDLETREKLETLSLNSSLSFNNLQTRTQQLLLIICEIINNKKSSKNKLMYYEILQYINKSFADCNLGLEKIADKFQIAPSYLSRFFKEQSGENISKYIDLIRMEHARILLRTTNQKVKDICMACGYLDEAHFIRKFKKFEGIPPMQYRKIAFKQ